MPWSFIEICTYVKVRLVVVTRELIYCKLYIKGDLVVGE